MNVDRTIIRDLTSRPSQGQCNIGRTNMSPEVTRQANGLTANEDPGGSTHEAAARAFMLARFGKVVPVRRYPWRRPMMLAP